MKHIFTISLCFLALSLSSIALLIICSSFSFAHEAENIFILPSFTVDATQGVGSSGFIVHTTNTTTDIDTGCAQPEVYTWSVSGGAQGVDWVFAEGTAANDVTVAIEFITQGCFQIQMWVLECNTQNTATPIEITVAGQLGITITACDSYDWNGNTYTESGSYTHEVETNNSSISFDGFENYIQINNISNYNFDSFTLGCWFKQDAAANGFEMIMGKDCPGCENINGDWGVFVDNGTIRFFAQNTLSFNWGNVCDYSGISDENWHFIVATRNGSTGLLKLFIDGVEVDSKIDFTGLINNIEPVFIGKYYAGASDFTTSFYSDNFMMWNTELTGQEIHQYMNCPPTGTESGLVGYWNFEEGSGNTAYDLTSNGNDGIIMVLLMIPMFQSNLAA